MLIQPHLSSTLTAQLFICGGLVSGFLRMYYKSDNHNWCRNHKVLSIRWCIHVCIQILWFTGMATGQPPCSRYTEGNTDNYGIDGNFTDRQSFNF